MELGKDFIRLAIAAAARFELGYLLAAGVAFAVGASAIHACQSPRQGTEAPPHIATLSKKRPDQRPEYFGIVER